MERLLIFVERPLVIVERPLAETNGLSINTSLSYHHLAHRAVAHAHDVQAAALMLSAIEVVDALDGCFAGTAGHVINARCFAVDVEELLPYVGGLVGRDATFGNRQLASRLVDIGKSKQATNRRNSCKAVDTGVQ